MKKIILLILVMILLSGCGIYNLGYFVTPDDTGFIDCIKKLDTPEKIAKYMADNFTYKVRLLTALSPYDMWRIEEGDCNDYAAFGVFVARYHGIEAYQVYITYTGEKYNYHVNAVYKVGDYWALTDSWVYFGLFRSIEEAVTLHADYCERIIKNWYILND